MTETENVNNASHESIYERNVMIVMTKHLAQGRKENNELIVVKIFPTYVTYFFVWKLNPS